jgi:hypothetical protein
LISRSLRRLHRGQPPVNSPVFPDIFQAVVPVTAAFVVYLNIFARFYAGIDFFGYFLYHIYQQNHISALKYIHEVIYHAYFFQ